MTPDDLFPEPFGDSRDEPPFTGDHETCRQHGVRTFYSAGIRLCWDCGRSAPFTSPWIRRAQSGTLPVKELSR
jgi:hypothetical protein